MKHLLALVALLVLAPSFAEARCLKYEPAIVNLTGELASKTYPGPPSYVSIARGDIPEILLILRLDDPICVSGDPTSRLNSGSHAGLAEVQLVVSREQAQALVGKRVRVSGTLFAAHTGHHRTAVLLRATQLRAAS